MASQLVMSVRQRAVWLGQVTIGLVVMEICSISVTAENDITWREGEREGKRGKEEGGKEISHHYNTHF